MSMICALFMWQHQPAGSSHAGSSAWLLPSQQLACCALSRPDRALGAVAGSNPHMQAGQNVTLTLSASAAAPDAADNLAAFSSKDPTTENCSCVLVLADQAGKSLETAFDTSVDAQAGHNVTLSLSAAAAAPDAADNLAAFSSEGPTTDGRIKPDLLAPGTLMSAYNDPSSGNTCSLQCAPEHQVHRLHQKLCMRTVAVRLLVAEHVTHAGLAGTRHPDVGLQPSSTCSACLSPTGRPACSPAHLCNACRLACCTSISRYDLQEQQACVLLHSSPKTVAQAHAGDQHGHTAGGRSSAVGEAVLSGRLVPFRRCHKR